MTAYADRLSVNVDLLRVAVDLLRVAVRDAVLVEIMLVRMSHIASYNRPIYLADPRNPFP